MTIDNSLAAKIKVLLSICFLFLFDVWFFLTLVLLRLFLLQVNWMNKVSRDLLKQGLLPDIKVHR